MYVPFIVDPSLSIVFFFPQPMSMFQIQFLNSVGDMLDLIPSLSPTKNSSLKFFKRWDMGHCSALIKVRCTLHLSLSSGLAHSRLFYMSPRIGASSHFGYSCKFNHGSVFDHRRTIGTDGEAEWTC